MRTLKKEFTFNYKNQEIQVKLLGEVFCAIFGELAKPLIIENRHIYLKESGQRLSVIPENAWIDPIEILKQIKNLLNSLDL